MAKEVTKTESSKTSGPVTAGFRSVIVKPRVSEKAVKANQSGKYIFEVSAKANKIEVKKAIELSYKVTVIRVNMIKLQGKKRTYGKTSGKMSNIKKAIVTLKAGQKLDSVDSI